MTADWKSGDWKSGDWKSGDWKSGDGTSGDGTSGAEASAVGTTGRSLPPGLALAMMLVLGSAAAATAAFAQPAPVPQVAESAAPPATGLGVERGLPPPAGPGLSGEELELATEALAATLRCPVCQGLSVADSPSESAQAMRAQIEQLLAQGYSPEQIVGYFERSYGEFVRLVPKARGFNLLVFLLPALGLAAGAALVARTVRRRGGTEGDTAAGGAEPLAEYRERVRRELSG